MPVWAEAALNEWGCVRGRAAGAEAMPFYVLGLELFAEIIEDTTRSFPLRVHRLRERQAPIAAVLPAAVSPTCGAPAAVVGQRRMRDALAAWQATGQRTAKTVGRFTRHALVFAEPMHDAPLSRLRRLDVIRFRDALWRWAVTGDKTASTAGNVLATIKALATDARDHEWIVGTTHSPSWLAPRASPVPESVRLRSIDSRHRHRTLPWSVQVSGRRCPWPAIEHL